MQYSQIIQPSCLLSMPLWTWHSNGIQTQVIKSKYQVIKFQQNTGYIWRFYVSGSWPWLLSNEQINANMPLSKSFIVNSMQLLCKSPSMNCCSKKIHIYLAVIHIVMRINNNVTYLELVNHPGLALVVKFYCCFTCTKVCHFLIATQYTIQML